MNLVRLAAILEAIMQPVLPGVAVSVQEESGAAAVVWRMPFGEWGTLSLFCPLMRSGGKVTPQGIHAAALDALAAGRLTAHPQLQALCRDEPLRTAIPLGAGKDAPLLALEYRPPRPSASVPVLRGTLLMTDLPVQDVVLQIHLLPHPVTPQLLTPCFSARGGAIWLPVTGAWRRTAAGSPPPPAPSLLSFTHQALAEAAKHEPRRLFASA